MTHTHQTNIYIDFIVEKEIYIINFNFKITEYILKC